MYQIRKPEYYRELLNAPDTETLRTAIRKVPIQIQRELIKMNKYRTWRTTKRFPILPTTETWRPTKSGMHWIQKNLKNKYRNVGLYKQPWNAQSTETRRTTKGTPKCTNYTETWKYRKKTPKCTKYKNLTICKLFGFYIILTHLFGFFKGKCVATLN